MEIEMCEVCGVGASTHSIQCGWGHDGPAYTEVCPDCYQEEQGSDPWWQEFDRIVSAYSDPVTRRAKLLAHGAYSWRGPEWYIPAGMIHRAGLVPLAD